MDIVIFLIALAMFVVALVGLLYCAKPGPRPYQALEQLRHGRKSLGVLRIYKRTPDGESFELVNIIGRPSLRSRFKDYVNASRNDRGFFTVMAFMCVGPLLGGISVFLPLPDGLMAAYTNAVYLLSTTIVLLFLITGDK